MPGSVISRTGEPVSFDVSNTSRFLTMDTSVMVNGPLDLELTVDLPDGLQLLVISDPIPEGLAQTPLPGGLPLFASGLGALGSARFAQETEGHSLSDGLNQRLVPSLAAQDRLVQITKDAAVNADFVAEFVAFPPW